MLFKNLFRLALIVLLLLSCSSDDDPELFLDKYDMTLWKDRSNSCGAMAPHNHQPYMYTQHHFMRISKNYYGFFIRIAPEYPENSCEQSYWECWKLIDGKAMEVDPAYYSANIDDFEILVQTEDYLSCMKDGYLVQLNFQDGVLSVRTECCDGRVRWKYYVKSDVDFNVLEPC